MADPVIKIETTKEGVDLHIIQEKRLSHSFFNGIMIGVGTAIGATFVFGFLVFTLSKLDTVPIVGQYITNIIDYIQTSTGQ